jgi:hypothetical protein
MAEGTDHDVALGSKPETLVMPPQGAQRRQYWKEHIERWCNSGMTQKDYCQDNGLKWSTFHYWKQRLQEKPSPLSIVQVSLAPVGGSNDVQDWHGLVLLIGDRYKVQVGDEFNAATLARLVQTLAQL